MNVPKYDDFMLPTLRALDVLGGSASVGELLDHLSASMRLSAGQLDMTYSTSGTLVVPDRMSWARSYLKACGLVASGGKGVWLITDEGRLALDMPADALKSLVKKQVKNQKKSASASGGALTEDSSSAHSAWREQLLSELLAMEPDAFERLAQRLLRESGFVKVEVTGKSGDGGIDGHGVLRMNLISFQVLFQCKRFKGSVSSSIVRDFRGAMQGRADKGLIITTGAFTSEARNEASRDGAPAIDLIDSELLCNLLRERQLGVAVRSVVTEEVSVIPSFFREI